MAFSVDQYTKLCEAIAIGATTVKYSDKEVHYRTLDEMFRLKQVMENELFPANAKKAQTNRRKFAEYDRGFNPTTEEGLNITR